MVTETGDAPVRPTATGTSLSGRVGILLTLALLPLGLIAVLQTFAAIENAHNTYRQSLTAQTTRAARPEAASIMRAFGVARGLADAVPALLAVPDLCVSTMQRAVDERPSMTFAGFIDLEQKTTCNSLNRLFDFSDNPDSDRVFAAGLPDITFNPEGNASGQAVVIVSQPVRGEDGALNGFVSLSFPTIPLAETRARAEANSELTLITFSGDGRILTSGRDRDAIAPMLPADGDLSTLVGTGQRVFSAVATDGKRRDYALAPIVAGSAYALGIWDEPRLRGSDIPAVLRAAAFPLLMWLASLIVAIVALRHQVIKPIHTLRMQMRSFADGRAVFRASAIKNAPRELQDIGDTFERMADKVMRDEADLENKVYEREILLREVHHRVKNNLQLMSSIINMQIRQRMGPEAEDALRRVQDRLASLAKFHQDLYESSSLSQLRADELFEDLARQTISLNADPHKKVDLRLDLDQIKLEPDQAGPLAMLLTEALTNAIKHATMESDRTMYVAVSMKCVEQDDKGIITLLIENPLTGVDENNAPAGSGLGKRLIAAFASQLEGQVEQGPKDNRYIVKVVFARSV